MDKRKDRHGPFILEVLLSMALLTAMFLLSSSVRADSPPSGPKAGDESEILKSYETSEQSDRGASGNSRGREALLERVIAVRQGGIELEFDLPKKATAEERERSWQFPVRVFKPASGPMQLLNRPDLEARVDIWLKKAGWTRELCGRWIFTWSAFRIECDPQMAVDAVEALDLRSVVLVEGDSYRDADALNAGRLTRTAVDANGETFTVALKIDTDRARRARAEGDVVVGEITREPVTLDAALGKRAKERISGSILVTLVADSKGNVLRRTKVTKMKIDGPDGQHESRTVIEVVERRPMSRASAVR